MSRDALDKENMTNDGARSPSVLVVDDNPLIVDVVTGLLRSQNYEVMSSCNGHDAWELLRTNHVDVVICDIMMPKMGGYELYEVLRGDPQYTHIPFVFLTALDDQKEIDHGKEVGADDYLCKPFEPEELLAVVKGKLARSKGLREQSEKRFDEYRRKIIHTLSHEFRTPLVAVNSGVELLLDYQNALDSDKARHLLDAVKRGGARLEKLVGDFMTLQQIEAGMTARLFEARATECSLPKIVEGYLRLRQDAFKSQGTVLVFADHSEGAPVRIVEAHIVDCIDRLISNAVKFSGKNACVELELEFDCSERCVRLAVKDRGIGLDMSKLKEAIDVFGQINREKLEQQGGGLGLAIASKYAAINLGRLEFAPREGGGTIVTLVLPTVAE
jgi:two-component system sensor histidine kinase/response regulator